MQSAAMAPRMPRGLPTYLQEDGLMVEGLGSVLVVSVRTCCEVLINILVWLSPADDERPNYSEPGLGACYPDLLYDRL